MKKIYLLILLACLGGCAVQPAKMVDIAPIQRFDGATSTRTLEVSKLLFSIPDGKPYGRPHSGLACIPGIVSVWRGGSASIVEGPFISKITSTLTASGVNLSQANEQLFATPDKQGELVLAGKVVGLDFSTCGEGTFTGRKGSAYVMIEWQVYSRVDSKVILSVTTEGSFATDSFAPSNNWSVFVGNAVEAATKNLVAKSDFRRILTLPAQSVSPRTT
jgi:serine protease Do